MFMRYKVTVNTSHYPKDGPFDNGDVSQTQITDYPTKIVKFTD